MILWRWKDNKPLSEAMRDWAIDAYMRNLIGLNELG